MTGVIWVVQVVHYPLFRNVGKEYFKEYELKHAKLISFVVIPLMLTELFTAIYILFSGLFRGTEFMLYVAASVLLLIIWLSTMLIQVRQHKRLSLGYDLALINRLVNYNWIRTIAWTSRTILLTFILLSYLDI